MFELLVLFGMFWYCFVFLLDASLRFLIYSNADFNFFFLAGSLVLDKAALTLWCIKLIIWDWRAWDLDLNEDLFKVSTTSCLVLNLTDTVSLGSSSVYNLLLEPLGFLPVPTLGSFFSLNLANSKAYASIPKFFFFLVSFITFYLL